MCLWQSMPAIILMLNLLILAMKKNVLIYGVTKNLIMECVTKSAYTSRYNREGRSKSNQPLESTFTSDRIWATRHIGSSPPWLNWAPFGCFSEWVVILLSSPLICLICLICLISFLVQILWCDLILKVYCTSVSSITIAFLWNVAHRFSLAFAEFFKELFCYSSVRPFKYGLFVQENWE